MAACFINMVIWQRLALAAIVRGHGLRPAKRSFMLSPGRTREVINSRVYVFSLGGIYMISLSPVSFGFPPPSPSDHQGVFSYVYTLPLDVTPNRVVKKRCCHWSPSKIPKIFKSSHPQRELHHAMKYKLGCKTSPKIQ